jgi:septum site-determining protein MinC
MMVLDIPADQDPLTGVAEKIAQAPSFFESAPLVLDLQAVADRAELDLQELARRLREEGLVPVGIQNGSEAQNAAALRLGLCPFPLWRSGRQRPEREGKPGKRAAPSDNRPVKRDDEASSAMLVSHPVRSGQRYYARDRDIVAAAPVSAGAELIADGHVHVYGPLRGRALAGVHGDTTARIFCQSLEAELVSIAGAYRVRDDIDDTLIGKPAQIYLKDDRLVIDPLVRSQK